MKKLGSVITYSFQQKEGETKIVFGGRCQAIFLGALEHPFTLALTEKLSSDKKVIIDIETVDKFDTAAAFFMLRTKKTLEKWGKIVHLRCTPTQKKQMDTLILTTATLSFNEDSCKKKSHVSSPLGLDKFLTDIGKGTIENYHVINGLLSFLGEMIVSLKNIFVSKTMRWTSVCYHIETVGLQAIPIVGLISFLIGAVLAYQGVNQLAHFGAQIYAVDFLAISVLREIAVLITSIVIAGRSGSAFAAQIGTMALNQEIDALRVLGLNPMTVLVIPRILALFISLPILVFFSMVMGLMGGMILCFFIIDLAPIQFWMSFKRAIYPSTFWVGIGKAPLFAILIALVGCYRGMQVKGNAESVGFMTTRAVVESIFLVIIFDALLSILFSALNI